MGCSARGICLARRAGDLPPLTPGVRYEIAEDAGRAGDSTGPVERADDVAAAILGSEGLRHQNVVGPEAALAKLVGVGRPAIAVEQDVPVVLGHAERLLRIDAD